MESARGVVVLLPRGEDAVGEGGRRSGAGVVVGVGEVCGLHGDGGGGGERETCSAVLVLQRESCWLVKGPG